MSKELIYRSLFVTLFLLTMVIHPSYSLIQEEATVPTVHSEEIDKFNPSEFILGHVADDYDWHITTINKRDISIPLPVILYTKDKGWSLFSSSRLHQGASYKDYYRSSEEKYKGKIVYLSEEMEKRPLDLSITKNAFALILNSILLVFLILQAGRWYKKNPLGVPRGFIGAIEMLVVSLSEDVIKPSIGKNYKKFTPYLLTVFFFIFLNNLMGLIPIFPGGANTTGNIAVTLTLAMFTFVIVNVFATKEYWREIFMPDVPLWLRSPFFPLMPVIEFFGVLTKPFALMVRLFANILAGHSIILALMALIFLLAHMNPGISISMTFVSVLFSVFMNFLELLVAFIQAYVFLMLSAVFIGLAQVEPHHKK